MTQNPFRKFIYLFRMSLKEFMKDDCLGLSARFSFYMTLSLAPLLILSFVILKLIWDPQDISSRVIDYVELVFGGLGTNLLKELLSNNNQGSRGFMATSVGISTLIVAATAGFSSLQNALNRILAVERKTKKKIKRFLRNRSLSLLLAALIGISMIFTLVVTTSLSFLVLGVFDIALSMLIYMILFTFIYKVLPEIKIQWRAAFIGASLSSVLFVLGQTLIGIYLKKSAMISSYGAAASLIAFLLWVYYSSIILFFGAEFIHSYRELKASQKS